MKHVQVKHEYFHTGSDGKQKTADIIIDLKRPDVSKLNTWNKEQREGLPRFIALVEKQFEIFIEELKKQTNDKK